MPPVVEIVFVWAPIVLSIVFVGWYFSRRIQEGLTPVETLSDRNFMLVFFYSGALLAIYLSTFYFFYFGLYPPEARSGRIESRPLLTASQPRFRC